MVLKTSIRLLWDSKLVRGLQRMFFDFCRHNINVINIINIKINEPFKRGQM